MPVFKSLLNRTVTVRVPLGSQTINRNPNVDDYQETTWSPIPAAIQPSSSASPEDDFFGRWPRATHSLWCARDALLHVGYLLSWVEPGGSEIYAYVIGRPEDEGGRGHHWRVPLQE
ncbi:MAG: hypothetical protein PVH68_20255, partial [Armatimonadota bacterium]